KAIKDSDARKVIAATPGFDLRTGRVRVKDVSLAGATPVVVNAEVEIAFGFAKTEAGGAGARWRAVEFRTGDRAWEEFDYLAGPLGVERVEAARLELEALAAEFETEQRERKAAEEAAGKGEKSKDNKLEKEKSEEGKTKDEKAEEEKKLEVRRGPLVMKEFAPMYKSARAVVVVDASFRLEKDTRGKWRVVGFSVGEASFGDFDALIAGVNARKAVRARADLEAVRAALEAYRRERGFYVVAEDETVLIDHLSPRYLKTVIRIDPWHRPYRYAGTTERFTLGSDGPDGLPATADDVTISG
ncbi:MAG TPA: type II secretion system protein GspG, partial [Pyrinomonadaceae bacterium]